MVQLPAWTPRVWAGAAVGDLRESGQPPALVRRRGYGANAEEGAGDNNGGDSTVGCMDARDTTYTSVTGANVTGRTA
jgi:hypothetical protein